MPLCLLIAHGLWAQQPATPVTAAPAAAQGAPVIGKGQEEVPGQPGVVQDKHAFGVLPNYRTAEGDVAYAPITTKQKFTIANDDTLDGPSFALAAAFSGLSQIENSEPSFGQGVKGYAHRYGTGLADQIVGNYLTEATMPVLFHQDPRYFRKGHGSILGRVAWAASRSLVARDDNGKWDFNYSEWVGNGIDALLGNAYYPDDRNVSANMNRWLTFVGTDTVSQIMKEFWPDVKRKYFHKKDDSPVTPELKALK
jgi:hypothetical protein